MEKTYVSPNKLSVFLGKLRTIFSAIGHKHKISDITDYEVDSQLSPTSANPVQNKVIDAEFNAISDAMGALEMSIDSKSDAAHNHDSRYDAKGSADEALETAKGYTDSVASGKANTSHTHTIANVTDLRSTLDTINEEIDGSIKSLSVSGKTITYTKNDGTTGTIDTQDTNTDTKVTNTLATTTKAYVTGTTSASTNTDTQVFDTGVYLDTTAGQLVATTFKGALDGNAKTATSAISATSATKATQDASGNTITSTYETKTDASEKLAEAKTYTDTKISNLINGAPTTLDTLGEVAAAMEENADVVNALEAAIGTKADASHTHNIADITNLQTTLDGKAASSHKHTVSQISGLTATAIELNYMDGVTSNVQAQLDSKAASGHSHSSATTSTAGFMSAYDKSKLDSIAANADSVAFTRDLTSGTKIGAITINGTKTILYAPTNTDTHYTTGLKVGASSTATINAAASNGSVYLNVLDDSTVRDSHKIVGSGATTVTSDANGVITISSTDNNTTYSAAGSSLGLVKSGGDVTISSGVITVNDDSHNHVISNIDNLQSSLDAKVPTSRTVNGKALSENIVLSANDVSAYTKAQIDDMSFITIDDIDTICSSAIVSASSSEVTF